MVENEALRTHRGPVSVDCNGNVDNMERALSNQDDKSHLREMTCCPSGRHSGGRTCPAEMSCMIEKYVR